MLIKNILAECEGNVMVSVGLNDLKEFASELINSTLQQINTSLTTEKNDDDLLTAGEVCKLLKISRSTLWRYQKNGILVPMTMEIGDVDGFDKELLRYRRGDVISLFHKIN